MKTSIHLIVRFGGGIFASSHALETEWIPLRASAVVPEEVPLELISVSFGNAVGHSHIPVAASFEELAKQLAEAKIEIGALLNPPPKAP